MLTCGDGRDEPQLNICGIAEQADSHLLDEVGAKPSSRRISLGDFLGRKPSGVGGASARESSLAF